MGDIGVDERIIQILISEKWGVSMWTGLIWLRIGSDCGLF
jgi:hypothetical protein